ncbi:flagellar protein FliS [Blastopirellula sp. JC732]|uniref:Flagellar protein FliS n=1 Tax=Blastopirellula sediminis TaxID=2894196 RepID=A0A9X1MLI0_9BACT|nr:flagellar protein FliS [Blastopirellula sediminis]MCC9607661.1 flagellar protein FliS [Blastopirellula sediminis]MCC9629046.1 flagellar protein FliS [Blastopirellula sediminis]
MFEYGATNSYLETEVLTATPQKLQMLLIGGAIRFAQQAQHLKDAGQDEAAWEALLRCRGIITEILINIRPQVTPLAGQVAGIYLYLFRELSDIQISDQYEKISSLIPVLEEERETWRQLCEAMPEAPEMPREEVKEITAANSKHLLGNLNVGQAPSGAHWGSHSPAAGEYASGHGSGFSLDA